MWRLWGREGVGGEGRGRRREGEGREGKEKEGEGEGRGREGVLKSHHYTVVCVVVDKEVGYYNGIKANSISVMYRMHKLQLL